MGKSKGLSIRVEERGNGPQKPVKDNPNGCCSVACCVVGCATCTNKSEK
ncbi:hypothetical protein LYSIN_01887 [Lysinibacillus sphaericus]|uniref:Uncharacterized protein n=1 Tax=Lysinibacillus sphaericus TaxID=1421 RepID=A0A2S5D217_LYSSH|nr:hypothetical protein LYSIN_01887 [Lysinibacillus sphaericus]